MFLVPRKVGSGFRVYKMIYKLSRYILIKQQAKAKLYITVKNDEKLRKIIFARSYQIQH